MGVLLMGNLSRAGWNSMGTCKYGSIGKSRFMGSKITVTTIPGIIIVVVLY